MLTNSLASSPNIHPTVEAIQRATNLVRRHGLSHRIAEDARLDGRLVTLDGRSLVNFGNCSYLGLETDVRLKQGACDAVLRYGVQFASSRTYLSAPLYSEFENLLSVMVGGHPLVVSQTTSLGHQAALPILVGPRDAVLFDTQVHASVQAVFPVLREAGVVCRPVGHNRLDRVEEHAARLAREHERVHYLADGVYSMHGDYLDVDGLFALLERQPALHAYVDDAHGVGWAGRNGAGIVLGRRGLHERMVVVLGLAKSFSASGAAIVLPRAELARRLFMCGSTMIFSGPLQPALLGAGIASAKIHLSDELPKLQGRLMDRIELFGRLGQELGITARSCAPSPIRFIELGNEEHTVEVASALRSQGYFVNVGCFPAVPRGRAGLRITLNLHHTLEDIRGLLHALSRHLGTTN